MRIITNTNIIVDDFDYCKNFPKNTFIHFLTHFHQDHWFGLNQGWDYGPIYCSEITKTLILNKFPLVEEYIITLPLKQFHTLFLNDKPDLIVDVIFFDANHIPGSVMILFQGFMGTILHTGDFRFCERMIYDNEILYPKDNLMKKNFENSSIHIDELIFDNTYCNPCFVFPKSDVVFEMIKEIINKHKNKHIIIAMGALGKEDICAKLAEYFQTLIIISEEKMKQIKSLNFRTDLFTINKEEGWIEIISKKQRIKRLELEKNNNNLNNIICITTDFLMLEHKDPDGINFIVPYSLHSNYLEMETFIKSIKPSILKKLVVPFERFPQERNKNFDFLKSFMNYVNGLNKNGESSYSHLKKLHTDFFSLSSKYKCWMSQENQKYLRKKLGIPDKPDLSLRKRKIKSSEEINQMIELEKMFGKKEKHQSLEDIANNLMSTHNNLSIKSFMVSKRKEKPCVNQKFSLKTKKIEEKEKKLEFHSNKEEDYDQKILSLINDFVNSRSEQDNNKKSV